MSSNLWPNLSGYIPPRGMREMLTEMTQGIDQTTGGRIQFYIDTVGVSGKIEKIRYNCYLQLVKTGYNHLLFRVTTPVPGPWKAAITTPEGDDYPNLQSESQLRDAIQKVLSRDRTKEIIYYLLNI